MTNLEKFSLVALGIVSGIALAYFKKCKQLQTANEIQSEQIDNLWEFINTDREEVDFLDGD